MTKKRARRKTTAKTTAVTKRTQPHGGALNSGGTPGNAGGAGRPPSAIRATAREKLDDRLLVLDDIAGSTRALDKDRIAAVRALALIGLGDSIAVSDVRKVLDEIDEMVRQRFAEEVAESLIVAMRTLWMRL